MTTVTVYHLSLYLISATTTALSIDATNETSVNPQSTTIHPAKSGGGSTTTPTIQYWALCLLVIPIFTIFGNALVIIAVVKNVALRSAINYFILSLAIADMLVAILVMPFAVYVEAQASLLLLLQANSGAWYMGEMLCNLYCASDVTCSTASILLLTVISFDRYRAVTRPIMYSQSVKNINRVWYIIGMTWAISLATASPMVFGLNEAGRNGTDIEECRFYNPEYSFISSIISFGIPLIIVLFVYARIVWVLGRRAKAAKQRRATRRIKTVRKVDRGRNDMVVELNGNSTTTTTNAVADNNTIPTIGVSTLEDLEEDDESDSDADDMTTGLTPQPSPRAHRSAVGKMQSNDTDSQELMELNETPRKNGQRSDNNLLTPAKLTGRPRSSLRSTRSAATEPTARSSSTITHLLAPKLSVPGTASGGLHDAAFVTRGILGMTAKFSFMGALNPGLIMKRERQKKKENVRKERKATKTLGIVVAIFLVCWVPFFWLNIQNAVCTRFNVPQCQVGFLPFFLTTWLGYMNSTVNPIIYTVFNGEFRKAFKEIITCRKSR